MSKPKEGQIQQVFQPNEQTGSLEVSGYYQVHDGASRPIAPPEGAPPIGTPISEVPKPKN